MPIGINADDFEDDGPLHITYAKTVHQSRVAPVGPHGDPSSSSSSSTSASSPGQNIKKKSAKVNKERGPSRSSSHHRVIRVKTTDIKLGSWQATLQFAGWRRALRLAVAGSFDEPDMAKKWIFAVEDKNSDITDISDSTAEEAPPSFSRHGGSVSWHRPSQKS